MSDKPRMADAFDGQVRESNGVHLLTGKFESRLEYGDGCALATFFNSKQGQYAAQAINNHDTMQDQITQLESTQEEYGHLLNDIHDMMAKSWQHNFSQKESGDAVRYVSVLLETIERERAARERLERDKAELVMLANTLNAWLLIDGEYRDSPLRETTDGILAKHKGDK